MKSEAEDSIFDQVMNTFNDTVGSVSDGILAAFALGTTASAIAGALQFEAFDSLIPKMIEPLQIAYNDAGEDALSSLEVTDDALFGLLHEDARAFAEDRAAELVGKRVVAGTIVDNPDARWAITESTRDGLRALIETAYSDGFSPAVLKSRIEDAYAFSKQRARLIAKTETAKASVQGTMAGWKRSGLVQGKEVLLSDDHDIDDECDQAADAGVIPVDDDFPSGDDGPPFHPLCNCSLIAELIPEGD